MKNSAYTIAPCAWFILLSYITQYQVMLVAQEWWYPQQTGACHTNHKLRKYSTGLFKCDSYGGHFSSIMVPFPQITLAHVKLTKQKTKEQQPGQHSPLIIVGYHIVILKLKYCRRTLIFWEHIFG